MLIEDESLYQKALRLYRTRNKIVHRGELPSADEGSLFKINESGAKEAMNCAKEVIKWFGVTEDYIIPGLGFIAVKPIRMQRYIFKH